MVNRTALIGADDWCGFEAMPLQYLTVWYKHRSLYTAVSTEYRYRISSNRSPRPLLAQLCQTSPACIRGPACIQGPASISTFALR